MRRRTIRATKLALAPFMASEPILAYLRALQGHLGDWSFSLPREVDRSIAGLLADTEPAEFLAACVAWALHESKRDPIDDPIPHWLAQSPQRRQRFLGVQLGHWLQHVAVDARPGSSVRRRSLSRVARMVLFYRVGDMTLLRVVSDLARRVEGQVRDQLAQAMERQRAKDETKRERALKKAFPYGINSDGSWDLFRSPGLQGA